MKDPEEDQVKSRNAMQKHADRRRRGRRRSHCKIEMLKDKGVDLEMNTCVAASCNNNSLLEFTPRPGYGQLGTKCVVKANHFLADISASDLSHYSVSWVKRTKWTVN